MFACVLWDRAGAKQPQGCPVTGAAGSPALRHIGRDRMGGIGLLCSSLRFNLNPLPLNRIRLHVPVQKSRCLVPALGAAPAARP